MARLIIRYPNNTIKEVDFDQPKFRIGFDEDNDLKLEDEDVTPHQAEIDTVDGAYSIVDVSDNSSTSVNGKQIERVNLNYGDRISFGPVVGLFYPSKKGNVSDKTKLILYLITGAVVIFLSFFLIFFFTSRRLSTVVTQEIGEIVTPDAADESPGESPEEERQRTLFRRDRERGPEGTEILAESSIEREPAQIGEKPVDEAQAQEKRFDARKILVKEKPSLPEVSLEDIKKRDAVAIPRGVRRLFFRKIPVLVQARMVPIVEDKDIFEQTIEVVEEAFDQEETASGETAVFQEETAAGEGQPSEEVIPEELRSLVEEAPAGSDTGGEQDLLGETEEGEARPAEEGFLSRFTGVFSRLFRSEAREELASLEEELESEISLEEVQGLIQPETEIPAAAAEGPSAEVPTEDISGEGQQGGLIPSEEIMLEGSLANLESLSGQDIKLITESQLSAGSQQSRVSMVNGFEEEPVYSEMEIQQFKEKYVLSQIPVSGSEDLNIDIVWMYPEGLETGHPYLRSGTVGKIDEDKYFDFLFGTKNGLLIAVSGETGSEILRGNFGKPFYEPVMLDLNRDRTDDIVITFEDGEIIAYNLDMERVWTYSGDDRITALPLFVDVNKDRIKDIVFPTYGMDIVAIDGSSGFEIWRFFDSESEIVFSPVGVDINDDAVDDVVFSTSNGFLYAIDGRTGWGLWKKNIFGRPAGSVAIGDLDGDNKKDIISLAQSGILSGYTIDGKLLFSHELGGKYKSAPSVGDVDGDRIDEILVSDDNGVVKSIEGKTRREEWSFSTEEGATLGRIALADVAADEGMNVLFTTLSGLLFVLDGNNGNQIALFNYREHVFTTPIIFDLNRDRLPEIISGSYEGSIVALSVTGSKKKLLPFMGSYWASTNHDLKNSGYASEHLLKKVFGINR
jgi:outer membrane protein assembly factor BamB